MKKFDITEGNENVLYSATLMTIGCLLGFIIFVLLMLFKAYVAAIAVQLVLAGVGLIAGLVLDIVKGRFKKRNA